MIPGLFSFMFYLFLFVCLLAYLFVCLFIYLFACLFDFQFKFQWFCCLDFFFFALVCSVLYFLCFILNIKQVYV